jgi:lysophospholipase L1-like esterase
MRRIAASIAMLTAVGGLIVAGATAPAVASPHVASWRNASYYLSLGDSLAQGVQPNSKGVSEETDQGYPNQLFTALRLTNPTLRLVKLGCPGETTKTMIDGGICTYREKSQLAAAVAFLKRHAGHVQLVTIDIGANDLNPCLVLTNVDKIVACLEKVFPPMLKNLAQIMTGLRAVDPSPGVIIGMNYYDPILADWLQGTTAAQTLATDSVDLAEGFGSDLAGVYTKFDAPTADVFSAFQTTKFKPTVNTPAFGKLPLNVALICSYTWECAAPPVGPNEHANVLGYGVIANTFLSTYYGG